MVTSKSRPANRLRDKPSAHAVPRTRLTDVADTASHNDVSSGLPMLSNWNSFSYQRRESPSRGRSKIGDDDRETSRTMIRGALTIKSASASQRPRASDFRVVSPGFIGVPDGSS